MSNLLRTLSLSACLAPLPVLGWDGTLGLQAHIVKPMGRLAEPGHLDDRPGYGFGIQLPMDFGGGHVLRPRVDYFVDSKDSQGVKYRLNTLTVLAEYNFCLDRYGQGPYVIAGAGLNGSRRDLKGLVPGETGFTDVSTTGLAYAFGVGWAFNGSVGVEVRYLGAELGDFRYRDVDWDPRFTGNLLVGSLTFTF